MKDDDNSTPDASEYIVRLMDARAYKEAAELLIKEQRADRRRITRLEKTISYIEEVVNLLRENPAALSRICWIKAADAAVLGGGITMEQLRIRRIKGTIPRHGWRQINKRVFEYREDVILASLGTP